MGGRGPEVGGGVLVYISEIENLVFFILKRFQNFVKINENVIVFENFAGNFEIFEKFCNVLTEFSLKFRENFRIFWKYGFVWGSGAEAPPRS